MYILRYIHVSRKHHRCKKIQVDRYLSFLQTYTFIYYNWIILTCMHVHVRICTTWTCTEISNATGLAVKLPCLGKSNVTFRELITRKYVIFFLTNGSEDFHSWSSRHTSDCRRHRKPHDDAKQRGRDWLRRNRRRPLTGCNRHDGGGAPEITDHCESAEYCWKWWYNTQFGLTAYCEPEIDCNYRSEACESIAC